MFTRAKLSGLWAGLNPRISPQNAAPRGVLFASAGSVTGKLIPLSPPRKLSGSCRTDPDFIVTAAQLLPTTICPADASASLTAPSALPEGHAWLSAQLAPATKRWSSVSATEPGFVQSFANMIVRPTVTKSPARTSWLTLFEPQFATAPKCSPNWSEPPLPPAPPLPPVGSMVTKDSEGVPALFKLNTTMSLPLGLFVLVSMRTSRPGAANADAAARTRSAASRPAQRGFALNVLVQTFRILQFSSELSWRPSAAFGRLFARTRRLVTRPPSFLLTGGPDRGNQERLDDAIVGAVTVRAAHRFSRRPRGVNLLESTGRGSAWLERLVRDQEVGGSNPLAPTKFPQ